VAEAVRAMSVARTDIENVIGGLGKFPGLDE